MILLGVSRWRPPAQNAARTTSYPLYINEILGHAGVGYEYINDADLFDTLEHLQILLTVGDYALPVEAKSALESWVAGGGVWVSIGGTCGMDSLFGVEVEPPAYSSWGGGVGTLGEGYLQSMAEAHPILKGFPLPLHFFNGIPVRGAGGTVLAKVLDAHQRETERAALVENRYGEGLAILIAPDVTGTVVRIQQGIAVTRDGVPAPDGTAPVADDVLKSGDGAVLDWIFDRQEVSGTPGFRAFLEPIADWWTTILIRTLCYVAQSKRIPLPVLWYYPNNLNGLGHISHDTDGNDLALGERLLEVMAEAEIESTWCVILPGYPLELIRRIREAGHELAMHFDTMSEHTRFTEDAFHEQWRLLKMLFEDAKIVSNKNHYLRWEGDTEFLEWCASHGIRLDQSKGASKTGEAGFNFGTCHTYTLVDFRGNLLPVLELATTTQDLLIFAPETLVEPLLNAVQTHYGIFHLLFHPAHIAKPGVAEALLRAVRKGKEAGFEWWTAEQIALWETARRKAFWRYRTEESICLKSHAKLPRATIMVLDVGQSGIEIEGVEGEKSTIERWGFSFQTLVFDIPHQVECYVRVSF